jgi:uncharacterized protein YpmB
VGRTMPAIETNVKELIDSLHNHQLKINGLLVVAIVVVLAAFGFFYMHSVRAYENALGKAEEREQQYLKHVDQLQQDVKDAQSKIQALSEQQNKVQTQIVYRDKQTDAKIQEVTQPGRDVQKVSEDIRDAYGFIPKNVSPGSLDYVTANVQMFVATKLDRDRLDSALQATKTLLAVEQQKTEILTGQLTACQALQKEATKTVDGYKNVAKKTKFQRVTGALKQVGLLLIVYEIGHKL